MKALVSFLVSLEERQLPQIRSYKNYYNQTKTFCYFVKANVYEENNLYKLKLPTFLNLNPEFLNLGKKKT